MLPALLHPALATFKSITICSICLFFVFCSLALFCISRPLSSIRPLFYVAEEQLSRAGHEVSQAGWLPALQSPEHWVHCLTRSHTHAPTHKRGHVHSCPFKSETGRSRQLNSLGFYWCVPCECWPSISEKPNVTVTPSFLDPSTGGYRHKSPGCGFARVICHSFPRSLEIYAHHSIKK